MEPDYGLRDAISKFYAEKNEKIVFLVDFLIDIVGIININKNDSIKRILFIKPVEVKSNGIVVVAGNDMILTVKACMDDNASITSLFKYKEPYPGVFGSNPFSGSKKQKRKQKLTKGKKRGMNLLICF